MRALYHLIEGTHGNTHDRFATCATLGTNRFLYAVCVCVCVCASNEQMDTDIEHLIG